MATKAIPVVAAKVPSTQTNFPVYIKPSAMTGWGSLTTAEANSIRFYSDSGLTTELAREVVSNDEIHVKVPSLTTTTTIYADYDGVRADYAATDTYGRNAVWSNYLFVYHMEGNLTDSTGATAGSAVGTITFQNDNPMGQSANAVGTANDYVNTSVNWTSGTTDKSFTIWAETDQRTKRSWYIDNTETTNNFPAVAKRAFGLFQDSGNLIFYGFGGDAIIGTVPANGVPFHAAASYSASEQVVRTYLNATAGGTNTGVYDVLNGDFIRFFIRGVDSANSRLDGRINEVRGKNGTFSADWITTEYNNQSDVATFWGTVTDAGGAASTGFMAWL